MKKLIKEGLATLEIDEAKVVSRKLEAFYNPKMALNRDLTISLIKAVGQKDLMIGLPLGGTGVRAVRMILEIPEFIKRIEINDMDEKAVKYIKKNFELNNIKYSQQSKTKILNTVNESEKVIVKNLDGNAFLQEGNGFNYIDIDPFGSPNFMLESSIKFNSRNGIVGVTATDTSVLAGTYPNVCKRKYWATSAICPQKHELGMRILIRKVQMIGMSNERALIPIFTYNHEHYYRIYFKVEKSKEKANKIFNNINNYFHHCKQCSYQELSENKIEKCPKCKNKMTIIGPIYSGKLHDKKIIKKMLLDENLNKTAKTILENIMKEIPLQNIVGSYDTHNICRTHKFRTQKVTETIEKLKKKKFEAVICSTNRVAIKTTAPYKEIIKALRKKRE